MMTPPEFVPFTFGAILLLYLIFWAIPMPSSLRLTLASIVTIVSAYDFIHDYYLINYHKEIWEVLVRWILSKG
jgi:hypothetical protein